MQQSFDELKQVLERVDAVHHPAEVHGMLCGLLIKNNHIAAEHFVTMILGASEDNGQTDLLKVEAQQYLLDLFAEMKKQLQDTNLGFELLLPDDDLPLDQRLRAVIRWAGGLVYGVAEVGGVSDKPVSEDVTEFFKNCQEIAVSDYEVEGEESEEAIYMELVEFMRMGALLAQEELQETKAPPLQDTSTSAH